MAELSRRNLLAAAAAGLPLGGGRAVAQGGLLDDGATLGRGRQRSDAVAIAWPADVPGWDPARRFVPDAQSLYRMVFDAPLDQDARQALVPHLVRAWQMAPDARSLALDLRDDVTFHDGTRLGADDLRWSFLERPRADPGLDLAAAWRRLVDVETPTSTRAVLRFDPPWVTAPLWLAFLGSFVLPRAAMQRLGEQGFAARPVGSGPYRLVEHQSGARMVFERNERYWGPRPPLRRVTVEIVRDASARVAALQSGRADLAVGMPVREVWRLAAFPSLAAELNPISRVLMLLLRSDGVFANPDLRLAAHHAIDKAALGQAFFPQTAVALSLPAVPGSTGFAEDVIFPFDPLAARQLVERTGHGPARPVAVRMAATSGHFPGDHDLARAIVAMWREVGIAASLEVIDPAKIDELNRAGRLPDATLSAQDNAIGDPEIGTGLLLNPDLPFSPWKDATLGGQAALLFEEADEETRLAGWQALSRAAVAQGAVVPLLQAVQTLVRDQRLIYRPYANGWVLPQTMDWA